METENLLTFMDYLKSYDVVIINNCDLELHNILNNFCRKNAIKFISTSTAGLCGRYFADFGKEFTVLDKDGEKPKEYLIEHIQTETDGIITV